jgi:hypothetical protein
MGSKPSITESMEGKKVFEIQMTKSFACNERFNVFSTEK